MSMKTDATSAAVCAETVFDGPGPLTKDNPSGPMLVKLQALSTNFGTKLRTTLAPNFAALPCKPRSTSCRTSRSCPGATHVLK